MPAISKIDCLFNGLFLSTNGLFCLVGLLLFFQIETHVRTNVQQKQEFEL